MNDLAASEGDFLARLSKDQREGILELAMPREVRKGHELFHKGESAAALYVMLEGRARVSITPIDGGADYVVRDLEPGTLFGEIAVFDRNARSATVTAVRQSSIGVIDARDFRDHLRRNPDVALSLLEFFSERLRLTTQSLEDSVFLKVEQRLAKTLVSLAASCGVEDGGGLLIDEPISQSLLGQLIGTSRFEVNRRLGHWTRAGFLERDGDRIRLLDLDALDAIAHGDDTDDS